MIIRRVDDDGDFVFGHGLADYLTENEAIALLVKQRLWLWLGEWFLNIEAGANWPAILGTRPPALREADREIRRIVSDTPGVVAITQFDMSFDHSIFMVQVVMAVTTEFSTLVPINITQAYGLARRAA
jgi:hypothetical protein